MVNYEFLKPHLACFVANLSDHDRMLLLWSRLAVIGSGFICIVKEEKKLLLLEASERAVEE
jgi:hypothetical protein